MNQPAAPTIDTSAIKSYRIGVKTDSPLREPPLFSFAHEGSTWFPEQLAIVGAALNAGLYYDDDIQSACVGAWRDTHPAQDTCLTLNGDKVWIDASDELGARRAMREGFEEKLKVASRGTWFAYRHVTPAHGDRQEHASWHASIADGNGGVHAVQGSRLRAGITFGLLEADLIRMEIYLACRAEQFRREHLRSGELIQHLGWRVGDTLSKVTVGGVQYSSAVIEGLGEGDTRFVHLTLTKRGSRRRYEWKGVAQSIQLQDQAHAEGAIGTVQVTDAHTDQRVA